MFRLDHLRLVKVKVLIQQTIPYPIWSEEGVYLAQTKVVWHHHVYEVKWWNKNETPETVLVNFETSPWKALSQKEMKQMIQSD